MLVRAIAAAAIMAMSLSPPVSQAQPKAAAATSSATAHAFSFPPLMGEADIALQQYAGKVLLVVNTASQCGFTRQYAGLEALYRARAREGFVIVGVPSNDFGGQEPGSAKEIARFCQMNYGVTFPITEKSVVTGRNAAPFYRWAQTQLGEAAVPQWNFHKLLIGRDGRLVAAFPPGVAPDSAALDVALDRALAQR
jgi:glutathione peroxidase